LDRSVPAQDANALAAFKIAHRQYIDDCDALQELVRTNCPMAHLQSLEFRRLVKWVLESYARHIARFGQEHIASLVQHNIFPIFLVPKILPRHVYEEEAPHGLDGEERSAMMKNEWERFREELGDGPELQQQCHGVIKFVSAAEQLRHRNPPAPLSRGEEDSSQSPNMTQEPDISQEVADLTDLMLKAGFGDTGEC
jgi:hypothetical protein